MPSLYRNLFFIILIILIILDIFKRSRIIKNRFNYFNFILLYWNI